MLSCDCLAVLRVRICVSGAIQSVGPECILIREVPEWAFIVAFIAHNTEFKNVEDLLIVCFMKLISRTVIDDHGSTSYNLCQFES